MNNCNKCVYYNPIIGICLMLSNMNDSLRCSWRWDKKEHIVPIIDVDELFEDIEL